MKTSMEKLLASAKRAKRPGSSRIRLRKWAPVIVELRDREFTYREIWLWLAQQGETVQGNARSFAAGASRIYRDHLRGSAGRTGA